MAMANFAVLCAAIYAMPLALAQSDVPSTEHKVKAAFVYKFASYVEWPPQAFVRPAELLSAARWRPILTVSETDDAPGAGGVINLVVAEDRVRFDVSLRAAEANNLKISSRLLGVARKVLRGPS